MDFLKIVFFSVILWFFSNTGYMVFPIFAAIVFLLIFYHANFQSKVNVRTKKASFLLFSLFIYATLTSLAHLVLSDNSVNSELFVPAYIKFIFCLLVFFSFYSLINSYSNRIILYKSLSFVLFVGIITLVVQGFYMYVYGQHINYLEFFMGREQRIFGTAGVKGLYRLSGMYNEPGSYAVATYAVVATRYFLLKKIDWLAYFALASTLLTFSAQAFASLFIFIFIVVSYSTIKIISKMTINKYLMLKLLLTLVAFIAALYFSIEYVELAFDYFQARFSGKSDGTVSVRANSFYYFFEQELFFILFGIGVNNDGLGVLINDTGFWFSTWVQYGILGLALVLLPFISIAKDKYGVALFLLVLLSKMSLQYPIVWLLMAALYNNNYKKAAI